jgi:hypothetical protein
MPDCLPLFLSLLPKYSVAYAIRILKGARAVFDPSGAPA